MLNVIVVIADDMWFGNVAINLEAVDSVVSSMDILPTTLAAAGIKPKLATDGVNLLPTFTSNKTVGHQQYFWAS